MRKERDQRGEYRAKKIGGKLVLGTIFLSFLAAGIVYTAMMQAEKKLMDSYEKGTVYVAKKRISKGDILNAALWQECVERRETDAAIVPSSAITGAPEEEMAALWSIEPGVILTGGMFEAIPDVVKDMKEPVLAGFRVEDIYQVVGGVLRAGDRIHIYRVDREKEEAKLLWRDLYVQEVFDNNGGRIAGEDRNTCAQRMNVYLDREDVEAFYRELSIGEIRVVKVL